MILKNQDIYNFTSTLVQEFANTNLVLPIKVNFFLQKNIKLLTKLTQEIEEARMHIAATCGTKTDNAYSYFIPEEKRDEVNNMLSELSSIEQEVPLHIFKLDDFGDIELSCQQMNAIMFMIEE